MLLYHYTNDRCLKRIMEGTTDAFIPDPRTGRMVTGKDAAGLWPIRRLLPLDESGGVPEEMSDAWTFALLDRMPRTHADNPEFPGLWSLLLRYFTISCHRDDAKETVLLEFDARPDDEAFVIDKAPLERLLYCLDGRRPGPEHRGQRSRAYQAVWATKTPLFRYDGGFSVPEVIIKNPIASERLSVAQRIPVEPREY